MSRPAQENAPEPTTRGHPTGERAEMILERAGVLFGRFGFHAVSLDEIGAGAGITGPAVYRYFNSKQSILALIYDRILTELITTAKLVLRASPSPHHALESLVDVHLDFALENPHLVRLYANEQRGLTDVDRRRVLQLQRTWQAIWIAQLRVLREDLSFEAAEVIVFAAQWTICSVGYQRTPMGREERRRHVRSTVLYGLGRPPD